MITMVDRCDNQLRHRPIDDRMLRASYSHLVVAHSGVENLGRSKLKSWPGLSAYNLQVTPRASDQVTKVAHQVVYLITP